MEMPGPKSDAISGYVASDGVSTWPSVATVGRLAQKAKAQAGCTDVSSAVPRQPEQPPGIVIDDAGAWVPIGIASAAAV